MLFGGNLLRQPDLVPLRQDYPEALRIARGLEGSDETITRFFSWELVQALPNQC